MEESKKKAREARAAIERLYVTMRHLFNRGSYKPNGVSGETLIQSLLELSPEIYGTIADPDKVELDGLLYVMERLPKGIEECRFIHLISREGYENSGFDILSPPKRRRNCYRVDEEKMYIEMTRGRSDIYDILTHLTFLYIEASKITKHALDSKNNYSSDWLSLEKIVLENNLVNVDQRKLISYLSNLLGRTFTETQDAVLKFDKTTTCNNLFHIIYWLGRLNIEEKLTYKDKEIFFSRRLRESIGQHIYGEKWALQVKNKLKELRLVEKPIHVVSANLHSFINAIYGFVALKNHQFPDVVTLAIETSKPENQKLQSQIKEYALQNGLIELPETEGTNLVVQIIDTALWHQNHNSDSPVLIIMDYAFGEQAFECMDELLKPYESEGVLVKLNLQSINIMGKAGILSGDKGDLMIPTAHVFEGTADNYPIQNEFSASDFVDSSVLTLEGTMITVLGTSLQNKNVLNHFKTSTWNAIGIEMEGAHYQKAIQSAMKIRKSIGDNVKLRYAYYASDNPLITGKTLASGSLGPEGIKPTYMITEKMLEKIFAKDLHKIFDQ